MTKTNKHNPTEPIHYSEVVQAELHHLESLIFGDAHYKGLDGREFATRVYCDEQGSLKGGPKDYISVTPFGDGMLDVRFDTAKMVIMHDHGEDRRALLQSMQDELVRVGITNAGG
jgi:hypothetical protein